MAVTNVSHELLQNISQSFKRDFTEKKYILSFTEYLEIFFENPQKILRNSAAYMKEMIEHFGIREETRGYEVTKRHFKLFERSWTQNKPPIVGQEDCHEHIYSVLEQFVRQGRVDKLILLHGPNGSSKSSTAEALQHALEEYSQTDDGAVYRFNWIFPNDKVGYEGLNADAKQIGFGSLRAKSGAGQSFAHLSDEETSCKIVCELKENPIYLLPTDERVKIVQNALERKLGRPVKKGEIPIGIVEGALGSKSKKIFDSLLVAYQGDLEKVLQHVQVERFFFSSRYRTGIACVEPQMNIDAQDKQLTMDKNLQNLPPVLHNIRLFEPGGELIDANRGLIEFSDLLKRPLEAFKYLITTIEKMNVSLASGIADLDLIMLASTNEKHLDAFKVTPDWPSFKGRFELVRVPYLLSSHLETAIYSDDTKIIERTKKMGPHAIELLAKWAVLTRLKQPDPDGYEYSVRTLIARLDPVVKLALYDGEELSNAYTEAEANALKKMVPEIRKEAQLSLAYEGRFGASPREMKMLLYFAAQNPAHDSVSAMALFAEIEKLTQDRSVYDYLQFEARSGYHDYKEFLKHIKTSYAKDFRREFLAALNLYDEAQYKKAFQSYLRHLVAYIKKERVENEITGKMEEASEHIMEEMEALIGLTGEKKDTRERIVAKIASWRVENPRDGLEIGKVFAQELETIAKRIYDSKEIEIQRVKDAMLMLDTPDYHALPAEVLISCQKTYENLEIRFGYTQKTSWESLVFLRNSTL